MFIGAPYRGPGPVVLAACVFLAAAFLDADRCFLAPFVRAEAPPESQVPERERPGRIAGPLAQAKDYLASDQLDAAIGMLKHTIDAASSSADLAEAYYLLASAYVKKRQPAEALSYLNQLLGEFPQSELAGRARLLLGTAQADLGNLDQALPALAEARSLSPQLEVKLDALKLSGEIYARKKEFARAIEAWREQLALAPDEQREAIRGQIRSLVTQRMDKPALARLQEAFPRDFPGDVALLRLIDLHLTAGEDFWAERAIRQFLERFPTHDNAPTAAEQLAQLKAKVKNSKYVLVALLPLSGNRLTTFGIEALNGIRLALDRAKIGQTEASSIGLVIKDTEASKTTLRAELADTLAEYHPVALIGPLLSRDLMAVSGLAGQAEVPFITPTAGLTDVHRLGPYVFSTALTPPIQVRRLVDYAIKHAQYRRFAVLHPENAYGQEFARLFSQEIRSQGGDIIAIDSFKDGETDFGAPIKRLKNADLKKFGKSETVPTTKGGTRTIYTPGFDALFIPASATQVGLLAPQLIFYDVKVPLLGMNAWNSPDLLRIAARALEGSVFTEGFFPAGVNGDGQEFVALYRQRYETDPTLFSAQAYDAARIVLEAIRHGGSSGRAVREYLAKTQELPTLMGPSFFNGQGSLQRKAVLIQIRQGKFVKLETEDSVVKLREKP
jgi:ABC-type branched-subunit amino acid transport system substrate-binding protein/outer membrane protein assembly factor BamD (BamD/ComL family)